MPVSCWWSSRRDRGGHRHPFPIASGAVARGWRISRTGGSTIACFVPHTMPSPLWTRRTCWNRLRFCRVGRKTRFCDYLSDEDVSRIRAANVDVLLRFGFRILKGPILRAAKHGVWSYHHGDNQVNRGGPAGFWEVMLNRPTTGSVLQILNEDLDNGRVIYRSYA